MVLFTQLLPLEIILPLLAALLCIFQKNYRYSVVLALLANIACLLISLILLQNILASNYPNNSEILYNMGNWSSQYGIELKLTNFNCIILVLVNFITLMTSLYGFYAIPREIALNKISLFYSCFLLAYAGLVGIIITNDIFNLYVFLEVSSLATYTLVASAGTRKAYTTAFDYLIIGTISATFYLIGVGFLYSITGTLNMGVLAEKMPSLIGNNRIAQVGTAFILSGVIIKAALFPLHGWLIKVYSHANSFIVTFLAGTSTKVGIYILIKYAYLILGGALLFHNELINSLFIILALSAILLGSICAFLQTNIRVMLAYSSVSQIGYIILAAFLNLGPHAGVVSGLSSNLNIVLLIIIAHSLAKTSLFMLSGYLEHTWGIININTDNKEASKVNGHVSLIASICCLISGASLIGIPLTGGFIGKFSLLNATVISQNYLVMLIVVISSVLTALYMWKFIQLFFNNSFAKAYNPSSHDNYSHHAKYNNNQGDMLSKFFFQGKYCLSSSKILYLPLLSCGILIILLGIYAKPLMSLLIVL